MAAVGPTKLQLELDKFLGEAKRCLVNTEHGVLQQAEWLSRDVLLIEEGTSKFLLKIHPTLIEVQCVLQLPFFSLCIGTGTWIL